MKTTKLGVYYLLLVAIITISATNTKTNLLHLFNGFLIALLLVSWGLLKVNTQNFSICMETNCEVFSGVAFLCRYLITNRSYFSKFGLFCEDNVGKCRFAILHVPPQNTLIINYPMEFPRRGLYRWKELSISSRFPFGFWKMESKMNLEHEILVLPTPYECPFLSLPTKASMFREGNFTSITRTASQDFSSLREYQPGDHIRSIHWKASAKAENFIVKEYEEELPTGVSVIVDIREGKTQKNLREVFEDGIMVSASLVWQISHAGYLILYAQGEDLVTYGRGEEHALNILRKMAYAEFEQSIQQRYAVEEVLKKIPGSSAVIYITSSLFQENNHYLEQMQHLNCRIIVVQLDSSLRVNCPPGLEMYRFQGTDRKKLLLEPVG